MSDDNVQTIIPNPRADEPCGVRYLHDILPEPVHHECKGCLEVVLGILQERYKITKPKPRKYEQGDLFPDMSPKRKLLKP